jgi:hypothetical protein
VICVLLCCLWLAVIRVLLCCLWPALICVLLWLSVACPDLCSSVVVCGLPRSARLASNAGLFHNPMATASSSVIPSSSETSGGSEGAPDCGRMLCPVRARIASPILARSGGGGPVAAQPGASSSAVMTSRACTARMCTNVSNWPCNHGLAAAAGAAADLVTKVRLSLVLRRSFVTVQASPADHNNMFVRIGSGMAAGGISQFRCGSVIRQHTMLSSMSIPRTPRSGDDTRRERAAASEPHERSGDRRAPASECVGGRRRGEAPRTRTDTRRERAAASEPHARSGDRRAPASECVGGRRRGEAPRTSTDVRHGRCRASRGTRAVAKAFSPSRSTLASPGAAIISRTRPPLVRRNRAASSIRYALFAYSLATTRLRP